jgi:hypothetical protein
MERPADFYTITLNDSGSAYLHMLELTIVLSLLLVPFFLSPLAVGLTTQLSG